MNDAKERRGPWPSKTFACQAALVANLVALVLLNLHPVWLPWTRGVVTDGWARAIWAANLSAVLQIGGNAVLLLTRPPLLERLMRLGFSAATLLTATVFYVSYPFEFSRLGGAFLDVVGHGVLLLGTVGATVSVLVDFLRLFFSQSGPRPTAVGGGSISG